MAARFPEIPGEAIQKFAEKVVNENTVKTSKTWMDVSNSWAESKGCNDDFVRYEAEELDMSLATLCRNSQMRWLRL